MYHRPAHWWWRPNTSKPGLQLRFYYHHSHDLLHSQNAAWHNTPPYIPYTPHIHVYQPYWYHHSATYPSRMYWCVASPPVVFTFCLLCVLQVPPISYKTYLCLTNPTSHIYKSQLYFTYGCCVQVPHMPYIHKYIFAAPVMTHTWEASHTYVPPMVEWHLIPMPHLCLASHTYAPPMVEWQVIAMPGKSYLCPTYAWQVIPIYVWQVIHMPHLCLASHTYAPPMPGKSYLCPTYAWQVTPMPHLCLSIIPEW